MAASATYERKTVIRVLRSVFAGGAVSPAELSSETGIPKTEINAAVKYLVKANVLRQEKTGGKAVSFLPDGYLIGVNVGVRSTTVGASTLSGEILFEETFETPRNADETLAAARDLVDQVITEHGFENAICLAVVLPGIVDRENVRSKASIALGWKNVDVGGAFASLNIPTVIESDAVAAARFEANRIADNTDLILVRSGTGISICAVFGGEIENDGRRRDLTLQFGHMTIVAGGKLCECGNRGCWDKYASAASAASLYLGDRPPARGESIPRFYEIVSKAENGDIRSRRTLEKIGEHLGLGLANVVMGIGIRRVIISGRLVGGWKFFRETMAASLDRSVIARFDDVTVEPGSADGYGVKGAFAVAAEQYFSKIGQDLA
jgi:predicted NBD/HSP70 family sugar kinase